MAFWRSCWVTVINLKGDTRWFTKEVVTSDVRLVIGENILPLTDDLLISTIHWIVSYPGDCGGFCLCITISSPFPQVSVPQDETVHSNTIIYCYIILTITSCFLEWGLCWWCLFLTLHCVISAAMHWSFLHIFHNSCIRWWWRRSYTWRVQPASASAPR